MAAFTVSIAPRALSEVTAIVRWWQTNRLGAPRLFQKELDAALLAIAEYITKTRAICMVCGNPANHTQRLVQNTDRVLLGATGTYEARCRHCFDPSLSTAVPAEATSVERS